MAGNRLKLKLFRRGTTPPPPSGLLAPSSQWNGTAGSGFGGSNPAAPVDPVRTGAKAICRPLQPPNLQFDMDLNLVADALAFGGLAYVRVWCEGNYIDVTEPEYVAYTDANGVSRQMYGYKAALDYTEAMALSSTGAMQVYFEAVPTLGGVQTRVMGPYLYYPRASGVGAGKFYTHEVSVNPSGGTTPGVTYPTLAAALSYMSSQSAQFPHILLTGDAARYSTAGSSSPARNFAESWCVIECAPDVTAYMGNFDTTQTSLSYDGLCFRGSGIRFETTAMSTSFQSALRGHANSYNLFWLDGIDVTSGTPSASFGGSGSGAQALRYGQQPSIYWITRNNANPFNVYFTEVNAHDLSGYGLNSSNLIRNSRLNLVSGSGVENNFGAVQGLEISEIGGVQTGFRIGVAAFTLTYSGSATLAEFQKTSVNGVGGTIRAWEDGVNTFSMTITQNGTSANTTVQQVIDEINATWTDWSATTPAGAGTILSAAFLSVADLPPSYSIGLPSDPAASTATPRSVAGGLDLITIADIHSNSLIVDGAIQAQNCVYRFVDSFDIVQSANMAFSGVKDFAVLNCSFQDVSVTDGYAAQISIVSGGNSHFLFEASTMSGTNNLIQVGTTGAAATFDAYSQIYLSVFEGLTIANTPDPDLSIDYVMVRTLSLPAQATNSSDLGDIAPATMFTAPAAIPPDFTPLPPLQFGSGDWAGRYLPDGSENGV